MYKINKNNIQDILPLTSLQEGLLYNYIINSKISEYHQRLHIEVEGELNINAFYGACKILTHENETLRTIYRWEGLKQPVQIILKHYEVNFYYYEYENKTEFQKALQVNSTRKNILHGQVPVHICVYKKDANDYLIHIYYHHIVMDGWSNANLLRQIFDYYYQIIQNIYPNVKSRSITRRYIDFLENQDTQAQKEFWSIYFKDMNPVSEIAKIETDIKPLLYNQFENYTIDIDEELKENILHFSQINGVTIAELLYAAWSILLGIYTTSNDTLFGRVLSGRPSELPDIDNAIGLFICTLPIRIILDNDMTITELLQSVRRNLIQTEKYQYTALSKIKKYSGIERTKNLFQTLFVIENYPIDKTLLTDEQGIKIKSFKMEESTECLLTVSVVLLEQWRISYKYNSEAFNEEFVYKMALYTYDIIRYMVLDKDLAIFALKQMTSIK